MSSRDPHIRIQVAKWGLVIVGIIGFLCPTKFMIALVAAAPWLVYALALRGLTLEHFIPPKKMEEFALAFSVPGAVLVIYGVLFDFVGGWSTAVPILAGSAAAFGLLLASIVGGSLRNQIAWRISMPFCAFFYGLGFTLAGNSVLDRAPEERYSYEAGFKTRTVGKYSHDRIGLRRLDPRAPFLSSVRLPVLDAGGIHTGDRIDIVIHRGWLGLDWYSTVSTNR